MSVFNPNTDNFIQAFSKSWESESYLLSNITPLKFVKKDFLMIENSINQIKMIRQKPSKTEFIIWDLVENSIESPFSKCDLIHTSTQIIQELCISIHRGECIQMLLKDSITTIQKNSSLIKNNYNEFIDISEEEILRKWLSQYQISISQYELNSSKQTEHKIELQNLIYALKLMDNAVQKNSIRDLLKETILHPINL